MLGVTPNRLGEDEGGAPISGGSDVISREAPAGWAAKTSCEQGACQWSVPLCDNARSFIWTGQSGQRTRCFLIPGQIVDGINRYILRRSRPLYSSIRLLRQELRDGFL